MGKYVILILLFISSSAFAQVPISAMYGDSTTYGISGSNTSIVSLQNESLRLQGALPNTIVENHGVAGLTCNSLLNGITVRNNWWIEMSTSKATIVVINLGLNDQMNYSEDFFKSCIASLITIAQQYKKIPIIETPNPTVGYSYNRVAIFATGARETAWGNSAQVIDQFILINKDYNYWSPHIPDGVHPDDALYIFKSVNSYMVLNPLLKSLGY